MIYKVINEDVKSRQARFQVSRLRSGELRRGKRWQGLSNSEFGMRNAEKNITAEAQSTQRRILIITICCCAAILEEFINYIVRDR